MSFGAAAQRGRRPADTDPCPCGRAAFGQCCGPIPAGERAPTPERLMRSRYTAFALGDAAHLRATWHPSTAPERLDLDAATRWEGLEIIAATGGPDDRRGTVEFRARWRDADTGRRGVLHEVSRFRLAAGRWYYLDGEVSELETPEE
ncbi:YchJ family protein [Microbacterium paulum]